MNKNLIERRSVILEIVLTLGSFSSLCMSDVTGNLERRRKTDAKMYYGYVMGVVTMTGLIINRSKDPTLMVSGAKGKIRGIG